MYSQEQAAIDPNQLLHGFLHLLSSLQQGNGQGQGGWWGGGSKAAAEAAETVPPVDRYHDYDEEVLLDGRLMRRFTNGTVQIENRNSGVIHEERVDGSLLVSLPNGKDLFQQFRGEPLLVYDTQRGGPPALAQVATAELPGSSEPRLVYHFEDWEGRHLVDVEDLRYFRLRRQSHGGYAS